jgi:hypothetical protein
VSRDANKFNMPPLFFSCASVKKRTDLIAMRVRGSIHVIRYPQQLLNVFHVCYSNILCEVKCVRLMEMTHHFIVYLNAMSIIGFDIDY